MAWKVEDLDLNDETGDLQALVVNTITGKVKIVDVEKPYRVKNKEFQMDKDLLRRIESND